MLAPSALAKKTPYLGPLLGPPAQEPGSSVYFKVVSKGKGRKLHPVMVLKFGYSYLDVTCTDASGLEPTRVSSLVGESTPVRGREFELTQAGTSGLGNGTYTVETHGRIPRKGPATGTIHYTASYVLPDTGLTTCDSTTAWSATITDPNNFPSK